MTFDDRVEHSFGGSWTEVKLNAVADYLQFFTKALRNIPKPEDPFETWYVDAFAGTGDRTVEIETGGLFEGSYGLVERGRLEGSARRALGVDPPFKHLVLIEKNARRFSALSRIRDEYPERDVRCLRGDANVELRRLFNEGPWIDRRRAGMQRAVVFLDPYGMSVEWTTLRLLAETKRADVWYLFPLHAALRQLSHDHSALDRGKREALNEVFGTVDWEDHFYRFKSQHSDLFSFAPDPSPNRLADAEKVEEFVAERLRSIFSFVSMPIPLLAKRRLRMFSLFLLSGNPSEKAISLIQKGVGAQVKKYGGGRFRT